MSLVRYALVGLVLLCGAAAHAQWATQEIPLRPGWNAVFLEVHPEENSCEAVFEGLPIKSVWAWNERFSSEQFVRDPNTLVPEQPEWLVYFPADTGKGFLTDLFAVHGGHAYLIDLGGDEAADLTLWGKAVVRNTTWMADSFNLVGFCLDSSVSPNFDAFFAPAPAIAGQPMYRLTAAGRWERVAALATEKMRRGEAYWIYCKGQCEYSGPLSVRCETRDGLEYGDMVTEQIVVLKNQSAQEKTVTVQLVPSVRPSSRPLEKALPPLAGDVALAYSKVFAWEPLSGPLTITIDPESERGIRLAVRRAAMKAGGGSDAQYESILDVSDGDGSHYRIPVTATKAATQAGLWVGTVVLDAVSEAGNTEDPDTPTAASSEFQFRLIVHVNEEGQAHLLREVTLMQIPLTEGDESSTRFVLLTRDDLIPQYEGVAIRDGEIVGRRISSPVFGFSSPVPLMGSLSTHLEGDVTTAYDDPLNPFLHRYHPDHNNLNERYTEELAEGKESFTFTREIDLEFTAEDPEQLGLPNWGSDLIGGIYHETLTGVHKSPISVQGRFRIEHVSSVAVLDDGQ